ncbi:hypothetical protein [Alcanivorax hongdengensis]|uniref:hypothetical protein n=1 Tax=Alcanivorax hongdengensis TaxID=519051 RepID=UPI0012FBB62C|nr:hypothetical protein [Alcanivorax hongdengensis]
MRSTRDNLYFGEQSKDFWVWVNPQSFSVRHQIGVVGCFTSAGSIERGKSNLPFVVNPDFQGDVSPFSIGVTHQYTAEYNFEINRLCYFAEYPSRLNAIYLLPSEQEAEKYKQRHMGHVGGRILKKVRSVGPFVCSTHDSGWVDFLRLPHCCDDDTIHNVTQAYWRGVNVDQCGLKSFGKPWSQSPITEVLFLGRVDFYDRALPDQQNA